jgi:hypothetical protein
LTILLLAPLGSSTSPPFHWTAPYGGKVVPHLYNQISHQACTHYAFPHPSAFNLASGIGTGILSTSANGCGLLSGPYILVGQVVSVSSASLTVPSRGNYTFNATWQVNFTVHLSVSNVTAKSKAMAESEFEIYDTWRDLTTGQETNTSPVLLNLQKIVYVNAQLTIHGSNTSSALALIPMIPGDSYQLIAHFAAFSESFVLRGTGSQAHAVVNWATNGDHAALISLSLA